MPEARERPDRCEIVIQTFINLWRVLDHRQQRQLGLLQILSVIMGFCTLGGIAAVLPFFTVLAEPGSIHQVAVLNSLYRQLHFDHERDFLVALGVGFVGIVALTNAVTLAGTVLMNRFALSVGNEFHVALFHAYLNRDYAFHARTNSSMLSRNVIHETGRVAGGLLQSGLTLVSNSIVILFIVVSVIFVNPLAAIFAIAGLGTSYVLIYAFARRRLLNNGQVESRFVAERTKVVNESFGAIKEITVLQHQDFFIDRFARACRAISTTIVDTFAISHSPKHILESLVVGGLVGIALFLSRHESAGPWLAQMTFMGFAAYRLLPALQLVFASLVRIRADRPAFESIAEDLRLARARGVATDTRVIDRSWRDRPRHELRLHAVSFRYSEDRPPAIRDVTLCVRRGTTIGFVGANGSGKTTLADLIAGLLIPQSGYIDVDGIILDESNRPSWQSNVAYVPQDVFLIDSTVADNIALGVPREHIDQSRMLKAARLAQLDECIVGLPGGYEEVLGERGVRLSRGQRQRVGIARALYRDASVLIMDEATNALDKLTESGLMTTLAKLRGQRTVILIAHRLSALQHCDQIIEMQNGMIVGEATYDEWLRASGGQRAQAQLVASDRGNH